MKTHLKGESSFNGTFTFNSSVPIAAIALRGFPHLIRTIDSQPPQSVWMDPMSGRRRRQRRFRIDRFQSHLPHQLPNPLRIDRPTLFLQPVGQSPDTIERCPRILLVQQTRHIDVTGALAHRSVVESRPGHSRQPALLDDARCGLIRSMVVVALTRKSGLFLSKSTSTCSFPILIGCLALVAQDVTVRSNSPSLFFPVVIRVSQTIRSLDNSR